MWEKSFSKDIQSGAPTTAGLDMVIFLKKGTKAHPLTRKSLQL